MILLLQKIRALLGDSVTPYTVQATASGDTTLITPSSGKRIILKNLYVNNEQDADRIVKFRFGSGSYFFTGELMRDGGTWNNNLIGCNLHGAVDEAFKINLDDAGEINVTVLYKEV